MASGKSKGFFKKHFQTIAKVGILCIPTIYTTLFLGSMWDPYGNVDSLPVAIVNSDQPSESNGKELAVGDELVEKLKENKSLDFHFVSKEEADEGLTDGTYYMVISIPEDFSANAATLLDKEPKKMQLSYMTNPGTNYIASKMSESALAKIEKQVSESVTESYAETIFEQLGTVGEGFGQAADGAGQLSDGTEQLEEGSTTITENLQLLSDSTLTFENGAETFVKGLTEYTDGANALKDGAEQLNDGMSQLSASSSGGVKQLTDGAASLSAGLSEYTAGVDKAADGTAKLKANEKTLNDGIAAYTNGVTTAFQGAVTLTENNSALSDGLEAYIDGVSQASAGAALAYQNAPTLTAGVGQYTAGARQLADGIQKLAEGTQTLSSGMAQYTAGVLAADAGAEKLTENNAALIDGSKQLNDGAAQLSAASGQLLSGLNSLSSQLDSGLSAEAAAQLSTLQSGLKQLDAGIGDLYSAVSAVNTDQINNAIGGISKSANNIGQNAQTMQGDLQNASESIAILVKDHPDIMEDPAFAALSKSLNGCGNDLAAIGTELKNMQSISGSIDIGNSLGSLKSGVASLRSNADVLLPAAGDTIAKLQGSLESVQNAINRTGTTHDTMGVLQSVTLIDGGIKELSDGAKQISAGIEAYTAGADEIKNGLDELALNNDTLNGGLAQLQVGTTELSDGAKTLDSNSETLINGAQELENGIGAISEGLQTIDSNSAALTDGTNAYFAGIETLKSGLGELNSNSGAILSGVKTYTAGVSELDSGMQTLKANSGALVSGASTISSGMNTLSSALTDGTAKLQSGASELYNGAVTLTSNNAELMDGAKQLSDGAVQIHDGAEALEEGSETLGSGITELKDGAQTLQTSLSDGQSEINSINADTANLEMFAAPIEATESFKTSVPTNGNAMAAYMMAVGLWVSGLAFCIILDPHKRKVERRPAMQWAKQIGELTALAIVQALLMILALMLFNGFAPQYLGTVILIACLSSIAFLMLEYTVNYFLGVIGDFLLLVVMVIQLSGCAGTYPKELSPLFFQLINPFLPFSYTVHGFRSGIASGLSVAPDIIFMIVTAVIFALLLLVGFINRCKNTEHDQRPLTTSIIAQDHA